jgi:hypothetical protein
LIASLWLSVSADDDKAAGDAGGRDCKINEHVSAIFDHVSLPANDGRAVAPDGRTAAFAG